MYSHPIHSLEETIKFLVTLFFQTCKFVKLDTELITVMWSEEI